MSAQVVVDPVALSTVDRIHYPERKGPSKRKFDSLLSDITAGNAGYPSPPMSSPPSPSRQPLESTQEYLGGSVSTAPESSIPRQAFQPPLTFSTPHDQPLLAPPTYPGPPPYPTSTSHQVETYQGRSTFTFGASSGGPAPAASGASSAVGATGPTSTRAVRRSKAHVASACINCKRAHLSCDVQRPCARCVASGKQVRGFTNLFGLEVSAN